MWREPLHTHQDPVDESHARGNRPRAIDARRRSALVTTAAVAALVVIVVLVLAL
jgi:hypothetical protein